MVGPPGAVGEVIGNGVVVGDSVVGGSVVGGDGSPAVVVAPVVVDSPAVSPGSGRSEQADNRPTSRHTLRIFER
jgi:hypothetical protein